MEKKDGVFAFPIADIPIYDSTGRNRIGVYPGQAGMRLRDYFANMAAHSIVTSNGWHCDYAKRAEEAYAMADAMIEARDK